MKIKIISIFITALMALIGSMPCCFADIKSNTLKNDKPAIVEKTDKTKKNEANNVFKKFLISMLWVAGSCAAIYVILFTYKKLKNTKLVNQAEIDISKNLNSPETIEDATKFFIEKF